MGIKQAPGSYVVGKGCTKFKQHLAGGAVLHHRKYGKLTVGAWLGLEMEQSHPAVMLAGGVLMTLGGILIRFFAGSPYMTVLALGIGDLVPPVWLMTTAVLDRS